MAKVKAMREARGLSPSTGRPPRADKGQPRGKLTSARGPRSLVSVYLQSYARATRTGWDPTSYSDLNEFHIERDTHYQIEHGNFVEIVKGQRRETTIRYKRDQVHLDLERRRFDALQELVNKSPISPLPKQLRFIIVNMLYTRYGMIYDDKHWPTAIEFFCEFYFVKEQEAHLWTYDIWRSHYDRIPRQLLPPDFKLDFHNLPGSEAFHPEWAYRQIDLEQQAQQDEQAKAARRSFNASNRNMSRRKDK